MKSIRPIIVLTPVRNDDWILDRFCAVTSTFADYIIVADQSSTDNSRAICVRYPKVVMIDNESAEYDEEFRQIILLKKARDLVAGEKIILALDADEVLAADSLDATGWQTIMGADPGTALFFEKPDLVGTTAHCIRYEIPFPMGYVDDGAPHQGKRIHSTRIPMSPCTPALFVPDIKVLHYALTRPAAQASKHRRYSVLENLVAKGTVLGRRYAYAPDRDYTKGRRIETSPEKWFTRWEEQGINMRSISTSRFYWQDYAVLQAFERFGTRRFWLENIWDCDWEECRSFAQQHGICDIPRGRISRPPWLLRTLFGILDYAYRLFNRLRGR